MAAEKPDSSSFPFGNLLALVLMVAGVVVHQLPLESKRPAGPAVKGSSYEDIQDVDARLWQDPFAAVEKFYTQSEQRGARLFELGEDEFALVSEHPDCDLAWWRALTADQVRDLATTETLAPLERRTYRWHCGCNQARMLEVLAPAMKSDPHGLFGDDEKIEIRCPRCGVRHAITREALEAFVADMK